MNVEEIGPKEAIQAIEAGSILIDVREEYELAEVSYGIDYTHIPLGEIQIRLDDFPRDKDIIIGCRSGKRSLNACKYLVMKGYDRVKNLDGGIIGWIENDCPVK